MILPKPNYITFKIQKRMGIVLSLVFLVAVGYNLVALASANLLIFQRILDARILVPLLGFSVSIITIFLNKNIFKLIQVFLIFSASIASVLFSEPLSFHSAIIAIFSFFLSIQYGFLFRFFRTKSLFFVIPYSIAVGINAFEYEHPVFLNIVVMLLFSSASVYLFWTIFSEEINRLTDEKKMLKAEMEKNQVFVKFGMNVAGMIHNLKSILHSVFGFQEIIGETTDLKQIKEYLELQKTASDALFDQIQNLLQTVKLYQQPVRKTINLSRMVELTLVVMNCQMDFKHNIKVDKQYDCKAEIYAAPMEIMQLLDNILKNSWEAVRFKDLKVIIIRCFEEDKFVKLIIKDSGCGIPWFNGKGKINILQSKEIEPGKTTKEKGSGIGLLYAQNLMKELNGAFFLTSNESGTEVELHFPRTVKAVKLAGSA